MCGIAGIRRYGEEPISEEQIRLLLMGMEHRGNDAAGICLQQPDGTLAVEKDDVPAWRFCSTHKYDTFIKNNLQPDTVAVILHARAATQGSPRIADNNHPLYAGVSAVVHNGCISNEDHLFKEFSLERKGQVDSDIFRAIVDKWGITDEAIHKMNQCSGSAAIAVLDSREPGMLLLARSGSPLTIGSTPDHFCFASEKHILHRAMRPWVNRFGIDFQFQSLQMAFSPFPDDTAWIFGPEGLKSHRKFNTLMGVYRTPRYAVNDNFSERQRRWNTNDQTSSTSKLAQSSSSATFEPLLPEHVKCGQCNMLFTLSESQRKGSLANLICNTKIGGCGSSLANAKVA